jgi:hypothetical protein
MADFFKNLTQAPRGNAARVQSGALRRRGLDVQPKLVHPDEQRNKSAATNAKRVCAATLFSHLFFSPLHRVAAPRRHPRLSAVCPVRFRVRRGDAAS